MIENFLTRRRGPGVLAAALSALAGCVVLPLASAGTVEAATDPDLCYIVADTGGGNGGNDLLVEYNVVTDVFSSIGSGTGTFDIEASALWPGTDTLYAIDADELGTIDLATGVYTTLGATFGTANGADGPQALTDADAMAFDPFSGVVWAAERNAGSPDYVFQIDPLTGAFVPDAFGPGVDYVVSTPYSAGSPDIDDFAIGAFDGRLLAVANSGASVATQLLVEIDRTNGNQTLVGPLGQADMEGLGVDIFGNFYGTDGTNERLYDIDVVTGAATNARSISIGGDYESVSCLTGDTSTIGGTVFRDDDADAMLDGGEPGQGGATIQLVRDTDGDGVADPGEAVVATRTSAADGTYEFEIAAIGDFVVQIVPATLPPGNTTTSPTELGVSIVTVGSTSTGNDFGFGPLPSLAGSVRDTNGDPIEDVTVTIDDGAGFTTSTTTSADGSYSFTGLAPGTYTVTETQPAGYSDVSTTAGSAGGVDAVQNVVSAIALSVGTVATGYDFVEGFGSIAGSVYVDADADGVFDVGESPIAGAQVTLSGTDDGANVINTTVSTNASGDYLFDGLLSGTYTITEVTPVGYLDGDDAAGSTGGTAMNPGDEIDGVTLAAGENAFDYDFGEIEAASISGSVLDDLGRPIAGVSVELSGTDDRGAITPVSTVTAADGSYSFAGLRPGTYTVTETQPAAYGDGPDSVGTAGGTLGNDVLSAIPLAVGASETGYGFTETTGSIAGLVYEDQNGNGVYDTGETLLGGVDVTLTGTDPNGAIAPVTVQSAADGSYRFDGLLAGDYTLTEAQPTAYVDGIDAAGTAGGTVDSPNDVISDIALAAAQDATGYTFGEFTGASISGSVVDDTSPTPAGIADVTIVLYDGVGDEVATTTTDGNGDYSFGGLAPGTYSVVETQPAGYGEGGQTSTWPGAVATVTNEVSNIVLGPGDDAIGNDFAETTSSLAGLVYDDANGNGVLDTGEALAGVDVTLTGTDPNGAVTPVTVQTGADGSYSFRGLLAGTYTVTETQPSGYSDGADYVGSAGGTVADPGDEISAIALPEGADATGYDFTEYIPSSIAGAVVDDVGNPIAGVAIELYEGGVRVGTTATLADGSYSFTGLAPGAYTVTELQPAGYGDGGESAGTSGGTVADDSVSNIVLTSGAAVTGVDFDETTGSLAGTVQDENGDPIEGVEITLTGTDALGNPVSLATDTLADGSYLFDNLVGGTYQVVETQPTDYGDGPDTAGTAGGIVDSPADTISGITLLADQDATGYDFTETLGSISGYAFVDADNDGFYTAGTDIPLAAVEVTLSGTDSNGAITPVTLLTNSDGSYLFDDLLAGTYTVTEAQPLGYADGLDSVGTAGGTLADDEISAIPLTGGADATHYDFGELPAGAIGGSVLDDNGDPIEGVEITLTGTDDNGTGVLLTTATLADGSYAFSGLLPGTYTVTETQPAGFADVSTTAGSLGGDDTVQNTISAIVIGVDPLTDTIATGNDFVEGYSTLSGTVFDDADNDGVQDPGELGIAGVVLRLAGTDDAGDPVIATATTDGNGEYVFADVLGGGYTLTEAQPSGFLDGTDSAGTGAGGVAVNPGDEIDPIVLPVGTDAVDYDFAEIRPASVSGTVTDQNGRPLEGVEITLTGTDDLGNTVTLTAFTLANGRYRFDGLRPGTYAVTETQPLGYGDGTQSSADGDAVTTVPNAISNLVLEPGEANVDNDFVDTIGSIAGTVFEDLDNDGVQDADELGIAGVELTLAGTDAAGAAVSLIATTDSNGDYVFADILGGDYALSEAQPPGYLDGIDTAGTGAGGTATNPGDAFTGMTLAGGDAAAGYDFGELPASSLSGSVLDENGLPLEGVGVSLTGTDDLGTPVSLTTVTLADGSYSFDGLRPGSYTITETQPAGYGDLSTTAGTSGGDDTTENVISAITLAANTAATEYDFVESLGSIAGTVFEDPDNDGVRDAGEPGIAGVELTLTGTDADGDPVSGTVVTDADGGYTFADLLSGTYAITETQPAGFLDGTDTAGTSGGTAADPGDAITAIVLAEGIDAGGYTFAELAAASVSGSVLDANDEPIQGVTVSLSGTDDLGNRVTIVAVTAADGTYSFEGLRPGTYSVTETQPAGFGEGGQSSDDPAADTSVANVVSNLVLEPGEDSTGNDFVETYSSLSGVVFHDIDDDGVQEAGEVGLAGIELTLTGTHANGDPVSMTVVTDADGNYSFVDLLSGTYAITETQPPAYGDGIDTAGTAGGTAADPGDAISAIALPAGTDADGYTFAEVGASIGGTVWIDDDRDGTIDLDEPGIAGVTITLFDADGDVVGTTVTDANGDYDFTDLPAGDYTIVQTQPDGHGSTTASTLDVLLTPAGLTDAHFGEDLGSIGDTVWADSDGDGLRDGAEPGVEGVTVKLLDGDGDVLATTTTDVDGRYAFDRLPAGTYVVEVVAPDGWALTEPGQGTADIDSDPDWLTGRTGRITLETIECADATDRLVEATSSADCPMERRVDVDAGLLRPVIDLALSGSVSPTELRVGDTTTFSYQALNRSNVPVANGARVVVEFPQGLVPTTVDAPGWEVTVDGRTVTLLLPRLLLPGEEMPPFSISAMVTSSSATLVVDATISALDGSTETTFANNDSVLAVTVITTPLPTTGSSPEDVVRAALLLVLLGALLLLGGRRRVARD